MPFVAGKSGNLRGKPPGARTSPTEMLRRRLDAAQGLAEMADIISELIKLAKGGDLQAIKEIFDRVDGKPKEKIEVTAPDPFAHLSVAEIEDIRTKLLALRGDGGSTENQSDTVRH